MWIADLGGDLDLLAKGGALCSKPFAENDFARAAAVVVGGVESAQADAPRVVEQRQRLFIAVAGCVT